MYKVREVLLEDHAQIVRLQTLAGLASKTFEEWKYCFFSNPASYYLEQKNIKNVNGWVLENAKTKELVGYLGCIPSIYHWKNKTYTAICGHSFVVLQEARTHSMLLLTKFISLRNYDLIINTTSNVEVSEIFSKIGFKKAPTLDYDISLYWVLNSFELISNTLKYKKINLNNNYLEGVLKIIGNNLDILYKYYTLNKKTKINVKIFESFDGLFDQFFFKKLNTDEFIASRKLIDLNWHYHEKLDNHKIYIPTVLDATGSIEGYAVIGFENNLKYNLKRMRLFDLQLSNNLKNSEEIIHSIIYKCFEISAKTHCSMFEVIGFSNHIRDVLIKMRPFKRKLPAWMFYYKINNKILDTEMFQAKWNCCSYDGDGSI